MPQPFEIARLDAIERDETQRSWIKIRKHFGIGAFGVNAWSAATPEDALIPEHEESSTGHEELYLVVDGHERRLGLLVDEYPQYAGPLYNLACVEALLGETDAALEHLARAAAIHPPFVELAREDEDFASIRDDPRFVRIGA